MDNSGCLRRLLNYPPVEDVTIFITSALNLIDPNLASTKKKKAVKKVKPEPVSAKIEELFVPNSDLSSSSSSITSTDPMVSYKYIDIILR